MTRRTRRNHSPAFKAKVAWRLSMTLETEPCVEALSEALAGMVGLKS